MRLCGCAPASGEGDPAKLSEKALVEPDVLPAYARRALAILVRRLVELTEEIGALDRERATWHAQNEASQRLAAIPGIGVITATAIAATVGRLAGNERGRQIAWSSLTNAGQPRSIPEHGENWRLRGSAASLRRTRLHSNSLLQGN